MSSHDQHHEPLATIDGNARQQQTSSLDPLSESNGKTAPAFSSESQQHQSLHGKLMKQQQSGQQAGSYVSPSDNIMSPASSKLNAFKQNRFNKAAKPKSLFSKMSQSSTPDSPVHKSSSLGQTSAQTEEKR